MARKKKEFHGFLDENAPKTNTIKIRINNRERSEVERLSYKLNMSKAEIYRKAVKDYYERVFSKDSNE